MITLRRLGITVLVLLMGCSPTTTADSPASEVMSSTVGFSTPTPTATVTPASPPTLTQTPAPGPIEPLVDLRCPTRFETSLADLGLDKNARLIVAPSSNNPLSGIEPPTAWRLIGSNMFLEEIANISAGAQSFPQQPYISPDKRWLAYLTYGDNKRLKLWVSSIDGKTHFMALPDVEPRASIEWANNQTLMISWFTGENEESGGTAVLRLNPFTEERWVFDNVIAPTLVSTTKYAFSPDAWQIIHINSLLPMRRWELYDYSTGDSEVVFPWMDTSRVLYPYYVSLNWTASGVSMAFMDATSLEIVVNIPPDSISQKNVPVQKVALPGKAATSWGIDWWSLDNTLVALKRSLGELGDQGGPNQFYLLNTRHWILYDYCTVPSYPYASADERYLAWVTIDPVSSSRGTMVMELATGRRVWLPGWEVLGWGEIAESQSGTRTP